MSMANDYTKHNEAIRLKWAILYFMGHDLKEDTIDKTIDYVIDTLQGKPRSPPPRETAAEMFRKLHEKHKGKL